jgi:hypothetical protein
MHEGVQCFMLDALATARVLLAREGYVESVALLLTKDGGKIVVPLRSKNKQDHQRLLKNIATEARKARTEAIVMVYESTITSGSVKSDAITVYGATKDLSVAINMAYSTAGGVLSIQQGEPDYETAEYPQWVKDVFSH